MLTQLKLALRILRRRKFFTFISLFGISFTIMALVVIAAMGDAALGDNPPLSKRDRLVFATLYRGQRMVADTTYTIDSTLVGGRMVYDSTEQIGERQEGNNNGGVSHYLYDTYLKDIPGVAVSTHADPSAVFDTYIDGRKITFNANYTDAEYWQIYDYKFVAGAPYSLEQVKSASRVLVITTDASREYFGVADASVVGRNLPIGDDDYRISGIVEKPATNFFGLDADLFAPYTTNPQEGLHRVYNGNGGGTFLLEPGVSRESVVAELARITSEMEPLPDDNSNRFTVEGLTFFEEIADSYLFTGENRSQAFTLLAPLLTLLLAALLLLPALNLVNINLSRVYERAPEIAVRKSFGATDRQIMRQFIVETLAITVLGSLLGIALALGLIWLINGEGWLGDIRLAFTAHVALVSATLVILLALLTGLVPALRFSHTPVATSLR